MPTFHHGNLGTHRSWMAIAKPHRAAPTCSALALESSLTCRRVRDGGRVGRWSRRVCRLRGRWMSVRWVVHLLVGDASVNRVDRDAKVADEGLHLCGLFGRAIRLENQRRRSLRLVEVRLVWHELSTICVHKLIPGALDKRELREIAHSKAEAGGVTNSSGAASRVAYRERCGGKGRGEAHGSQGGQHGKGKRASGPCETAGLTNVEDVTRTLNTTL